MRMFTPMRTWSSRPTRRPLRTFGAAASALVATLILPFAASASTPPAAYTDLRAFVPPALLEAATAEPGRTFDVIVQSVGGKTSADAAGAVVAQGVLASPKRFSSVNAVRSALTGKQLLQLAKVPLVAAITPNAPVRLTGFSNKQQWPYVIGAPKIWNTATASMLQMPTIAIVDSGIDATRSDFAGRVLEQVVIGTPGANSPGDGRGHGTFVASIAAGAGASYAGVAATAPLVSLDVVDDAGNALTSDVIGAADWILANKDRLNIRVANFSLHASNPGTFMYDPLNKAVERLWFSGVTVVAAAGNYGAVGRGVPFAPGNDPFIITVGASDIDGSVSINNDVAAPWSAYGYTLDGFAKPELGAPGRYMVGAVPTGATLYKERPDRIVAPGYMQMSGTSFSAPVVAGAAAALLAKRPHLTPDQVKGALMLTARAMPLATANSAGVGELNIAGALDVEVPPNPNIALRRFVVPDPQGGPLPVFDAASWVSAAKTDASWVSASWVSASWVSASWVSASWVSASWVSASWTSASWTSASWVSASWTSASWVSASWISSAQSDASWVSNAADDATASGGYWMTDEELIAAELELGLDLNGDGAVGVKVTTIAATGTSLLSP
jgi:serine protease AprX